MQFCTFNIYTLHASLSASLVPSTNMPLGEEILSFGQNLERKKGTNEAWEIQLIGWRGEMLRLYIWLRLHWGKYIEDKSWLCSSSIGELWRRVVPGSMVWYSPRCCACVNASTSFPGRNGSIIMLSNMIVHILCITNILQVAPASVLLLLSHSNESRKW